jgi:hypothetical protein
MGAEGSEFTSGGIVGRRAWGGAWGGWGDDADRVSGGEATVGRRAGE